MKRTNSNPFSLLPWQHSRKLLAIAFFAMSFPWQATSQAQTTTNPPQQLQRPYSSSRCKGRDVQPVLVEFIARGDDWGNVWLNGKNLFQPRNFNRRYRINLCPKGYRVIITGTTKSDVWASGYLDVGKTNFVRIAFSKNGGVEVSGDANAWLPDAENDPLEIWQH